MLFLSHIHFGILFLFEKQPYIAHTVLKLVLFEDGLEFLIFLPSPKVLGLQLSVAVLAVDTCTNVFLLKLLIYF